LETKLYHHGTTTKETERSIEFHYHTGKQLPQSSPCPGTPSAASSFQAYHQFNLATPITFVQSLLAFACELPSYRVGHRATEAQFPCEPSNRPESLTMPFKEIRSFNPITPFTCKCFRIKLLCFAVV
ncbi:hypothetical protein M758_2G166200, partial [Ceratodon purpureus]